MRSVLNDRENIALLDNDILLGIKLDFGSRVFGINDLVAGFDLHDNFLAVYNAAGAGCNDFRLLGLFLVLAGKNDTGFGGGLRLKLL